MKNHSKVREDKRGKDQSLEMVGGYSTKRNIPYLWSAQAKVNIKMS